MLSNNLNWDYFLAHTNAGDAVVRYIWMATFFLITWLVFAIWDVFSSSDTVKVYPAHAVENRVSEWREGRLLPSLNPRSVREYLIQSSGVVLKGTHNSETTTLNNCSVFDRDNWTCSWDDNSATFGMHEGSYFKRVAPSAVQTIELTYLSRFEYIILGCRWDFLDFGRNFWGTIQPIVCGLRPFFT